MSTREKLKKQAEPYLEAGEQPRVAFIAKKGPETWKVLAGVVAFAVVVGLATGLYIGPIIAVVLFNAFYKFRGVVVTDRGLVVFERNWFTGKVKSLLARVPGGRVQPLSDGQIRVGNEDLRVVWRFRKDVQAATTA